MENMLVLQWPLPFSSDNDLDLLVSLEAAILEGLGNLGTVDGHDIGSGEMNIFIYTENPVGAFEYIKTIPSISQQLSKMKAGYREVGGEVFTPIHPEGLDSFEIA